MDPTTRFSGLGDGYARHRPGYPATAIDAVIEGLGAPRGLLAIDVGAGTGISSRLLADRGVRVVAIEPNASMREAAESHDRVTFVEGTAEAIPAETGSADLVLAAQAFHWFRAEAAVRECARVLRPGGRLALVWNRRSADDPLTRGYRDALLAAGASPAIEAMDADVAAVARSKLFGPLTRATFGHRQVLDLAALVGRARSASYAPRGGAALARMVALLEDLHGRHRDPGGLVSLVYETEVLRASRL